MKEALSMKDLQPSTDTYKVEGTVLTVKSTGNAELKQPIRLVVKIEESNEVINVVSWAYDFLNLMDESAKSIDIYEMEIQVTVYDSQPSYRIKSMHKTNKESKNKIISFVDENESQKEISRILNEYVVDEKLKRLIEISLAGKDFWNYPAAKLVHHAYKHGLAQHTMETLENVEYLYKTYGNFNIELAITGAVLHDIGKTYEYAEDGNFTLDGYLTSHIPLGIMIITENMIKAKIDPKSTIGVLLISIIASHHGKTEYGSNTSPTTLEGVVVSIADTMSATMRCAISALSQLTPGSRTDHLIGVFDGAQLVKLDDNILSENIDKNN